MPAATEDEGTLLKELSAFVRRYGVKAIIGHGVEIYAGWLLRSLPGVEGLFLRSLLYRAIFKSAGKDLLIYPSVYIIFGAKIAVGERVAVNVGTYIDGRGGVTIGDHVMIGPHCAIASVEHSFARTDVPMYTQPVKYGEIRIGNDVWLGAHVVVKCGVTIGDGSVIAAGAVVTSDVPPGCIFGGVPGRVIRARRPAEGVRC